MRGGRQVGRTAIITGASRGIGLAIARRLVDDGARVVVSGRRQEALDAAVEELGESEVALGVAGHAADAGHRGATVERAIETFGSVDLVVNNTGINPVHGRMIDLNLEVARKIVEVNARSALAWVQQVHRTWMSDQEERW